MRLGWTTGKYSITYRAVKTVRINGKNKTQIVKSFGSEKYICETYGVTDAKALLMVSIRKAGRGTITSPPTIPTLNYAAQFAFPVVSGVPGTVIS